MAANSEDVRGLHLEAESYEELVNELRDIGSYLLRKNHGLTEEELLNVVTIFKLDSRQEPLQSDVENRYQDTLVSRKIFESLPLAAFA